MVVVSVVVSTIAVVLATGVSVTDVSFSTVEFSNSSALTLLFNTNSDEAIAVVAAIFRNVLFFLTILPSPYNTNFNIF